MLEIALGPKSNGPQAVPFQKLKEYPSAVLNQVSPTANGLSGSCTGAVSL